MGLFTRDATYLDPPDPDDDLDPPERDADAENDRRQDKEDDRP